MRDVYIYPAVFDYADDGISVFFPDVPGCYTCGNNDEEAVKMAEDALGLCMCGMEEDNEEIPEPSKGNKITLEPNQRIFLIRVWMPKVRNEVKPIYVKKTLTIPSFLNMAAQEANINFSNVLQEALKQKLGI